MSRAELILYATPTGPLADGCARYYAAAERVGPTVAQTYPPHCTLTGFFRRPVERVAAVAAEIGAVLDAAGPVPDGAVDVTALSVTGHWIGFELTSPWLLDLTRQVVDAHRLHPGDDALRPKDWLHVSLAYGVDDLGPYGPLVEATDLDPGLTAGWEVALWERSPGNSWRRGTLS